MKARTAAIAPNTMSSQIAALRNEFRTTQTPMEQIARLRNFILVSYRLLSLSVIRKQPLPWLREDIKRLYLAKLGII